MLLLMAMEIKVSRTHCCVALHVHVVCTDSCSQVDGLMQWSLIDKAKTISYCMVSGSS